MALQFIVGLRNNMLDQVKTSLDAGLGAAIIAIYSGAIPASVATPLSGNTLLAQLTASDPSAAAAASGVLTLSAITQDASANATGTASWFRLYSSADGVTISEANAVMQGTVTVDGGGGDLTFTSVSFVSGEPISVTSWTITAPGA